MHLSLCHPALMSQIVEHTEINEYLEEIAESLIVEHLLYTISIATNIRTPGIFTTALIVKRVWLLGTPEYWNLLILGLKLIHVFCVFHRFFFLKCSGQKSEVNWSHMYDIQINPSIEVIGSYFSFSRWPDKITLLRGNHESRQITQVYGFYGKTSFKIFIHDHGDLICKLCSHYYATSEIL